MSYVTLPKRRYVALVGLPALTFFVLGAFSFIETLAITRSRSPHFILACMMLAPVIAVERLRIKQQQLARSE